MSNQKSPKYCYCRKGRWVYVPYKDGKRGREITLRFEGKLIRKGDPMSRVWAAYESIEFVVVDSLTYLIDSYLKSSKFNNLMLRTKRDYRESAEFLKTKKLKNGAIFGAVSYEAITPGVITKLKDSMSEHPTAAKHRLQFLAAVYSWAHARDICSKNPCRMADKSVSGSKKTRSYVEDADFFFALEVAKNLSSYLYPMMILAYCCRARVGEISRTEIVEGQTLESGLRLNDISAEGILVIRSKGSLPEVTLWSDFLRVGYDAATAYSKKQIKKSKIRHLIKNPYLIHDRNQQPIKKNAFDSAWQRLMKSCGDSWGNAQKELTEQNRQFNRFSFHEIKAKGIDDHKNQESGHKTASAKAVYLRKTKRTDSTK